MLKATGREGNFADSRFIIFIVLTLVEWIAPLDSTPWIPDSLSVKLEFLSPIVSGIPDFLSCSPDSKAQDSGFYKKK